MQSVLQAEHIFKTIGKKKILDDVSLSIMPGEIVGLVGPNGAGKTSLMKLIAGYNFPTAGTIAIEGHNVEKNHAAAMKVAAFLVEEPGLYPNLSGRKHLEMVCDSRGISHDAIQSVADFLNFESQLKNKTKTYSIGMKQRLGLALCWVSAPTLLVLDEPVNGLDPDGIFLLREKMQKAADGGAAVLISSHLLSELQKVATRFVFLRQGKVIGENAGENFEELENYYRHLFAEGGGEK